MLEKEKRKDNKQTILISSLILGLVAVIIMVLLLVRYCKPKEESPKEKQSYLFNFEPTLVTDTTSLHDKTLSLNVTVDSKYRCELSITSGVSNAMLGNYSIHDYMFKSYGQETNTLSISVKFKDVSTDVISVVTDYEDLEYVLYLGDKDSHSIATSGYTVSEEGVLSYTSNTDIYLYKVAVGVSL